MSEQQQPTEGQGSESGGDGFKPITTQEDFNKALGARLAAERKKFDAELAPFKQRAAEADAEAEKTKTAEQKLTDRIAALEKDNAAKTTDALRARVARQHGITDDKQVELYLTGSTEEVLTEQAKGLSALITARKKAGGHVPREGESTTTPSSDDSRAFVRDFFGSGGD